MYIRPTVRENPWAGNDKDKVVSYAVETPLVCEGKNMDTITYSVDKGFFRIVTPKKMSYVIDGEEYKPSDRFIEELQYDWESTRYDGKVL